MGQKVDIDSLASLSRLLIEPSERETFAKDVEDILDYVQKLQSLDTTGVQPVSQVHGIKNVYRKDKLRESTVLDRLLELAPEREGDFIKVPIVIDRET